jgi:predicted component of viral defense system (DUF524 family)
MHPHLPAVTAWRQLLRAGIANRDNPFMEDVIPIRDLDGDPTPALPDAFTNASGLVKRVPLALLDELAPAEWIVHEWTEYTLSFARATRLRIGSRSIEPMLRGADGTGHFRVRFENELGLAVLQPLADGGPSGKPLHLEVIAKKFNDVDRSLAFMRDMLADLFARGKALPFDISTKTFRAVRDEARAPNDLFAYHFFRHRHEELVRAIQAVLGSPHRVLSDRVERVRPHEVKRIDTEAIMDLLRSSGGRSGAMTAPIGTSVLHRLQPERVIQRIPEETFDTPENRFILSAARRMYATANRIRDAAWYRADWSPVPDHARKRVEGVHHHLRQLVTDRRFIDLEPVAGIPAQSRVLQRKDGYRELTLLWNAFHRFQEPVYQKMQNAIDLRDVATLYEFWLLFELIDAIRRHTGVRPRLRGFDAMQHPGNAFTAVFPKVGTLTYQASFGGKHIYSGITLRPDFVWRAASGRRVVMDAKFRVSYPWPRDDEEVASFDDSRATTDDITKMHAYRDAIDGVSAAIVLYPGANGFMKTTDRQTALVHHIDELIESIVSGDLDGIGAIPMSPIR